MSPRDRLALVTDTSENIGDETPPVEDLNADSDLVFRMKLSLRLDAMDKRQQRIEKELQRIAQLPETIAALARAKNRGAY